jgi:putative membrane protein
MKLSFVLLSGALLFGAASCSSKPDSVEQAQQTTNAEKGTAKADTAVSTAQGVGGVQRPAFDAEFMAKAASGGMLEVQLGQQLAQKATTPEAKQFAQQMVIDHTKNNAELKALAAQKNITLPTTLGKDQQQVYDDVLAEKGPALDQKYVKAMLADHGEDIKNFAQKTLPVLQMHLGMLQKIQPVVEAKK